MDKRKNTAFPGGKPKIPYLTLVPVLEEIIIESGLGADGVANSTRWSELVREQCGPEFAGVPTDDVQTLITSARKRSMLTPSTDKGHGPPVLKPLSEEYERYMRSDEWKRRRQEWIDFYDGHCCICRSSGPLEIHHNTYANFGNEQHDDCIPVCHSCHLVCDHRRQVEHRESFPEMVRQAELEKQVAGNGGNGQVAELF